MFPITVVSVRRHFSCPVPSCLGVLVVRARFQWRYPRLGSNSTGAPVTACYFTLPRFRSSPHRLTKLLVGGLWLPRPVPPISTSAVALRFNALSRPWRGAGGFNRLLAGQRMFAAPARGVLLFLVPESVVDGQRRPVVLLRAHRVPVADCESCGQPVLAGVLLVSCAFLVVPCLVLRRFGDGRVGSARLAGPRPSQPSRSPVGRCRPVGAWCPVGALRRCGRGAGCGCGWLGHGVGCPFAGGGAGRSGGAAPPRQYHPTAPPRAAQRGATEFSPARDNPTIPQS